MQSEQNSIMALFNAIAKHGEINRAALSQLTGFSLMTVGKAVDTLERYGVITQRKLSSGKAGRKMSVCSVNSSRGILLYDLTCKKPLVRVCDLSLSVSEEYQSEATDLSELVAEGFGYLLERFGGELIGIGCVVPNGKGAEYCKLLSDTLGNPPELVVESKAAYTAANSRRFDTSGISAFIRLFENGHADCSITINGGYYAGAHGLSCNLFDGLWSKEALAKGIYDIWKAVDPARIHIACELEKDCNEVSKAVNEQLDKYGLIIDLRPDIIIEAMSLCSSSVDGAGLLLRTDFIMKKIENNS